MFERRNIEVRILIQFVTACIYDVNFINDTDVAIVT